LFEESQTKNLLDEKTRIENDYQELVTEQNDLLALCSTYEDQLRTCRGLLESAGLNVRLNFFFNEDR